jgi:hypothetical protein
MHGLLLDRTWIGLEGENNEQHLHHLLISGLQQKEGEKKERNKASDSWARESRLAPCLGTVWLPLDFENLDKKKSRNSKIPSNRLRYRLVTTGF